MQTLRLWGKLSGIGPVVVLVVILQGCSGGGGDDDTAGSSSSSSSSSTSSSSSSSGAPVFDSNNNDECANADRVAVAGSFDGSIHEINDIHDCFLFTAPAAGDYDFSLKFYDPAYDLDIKLYATGDLDNAFKSGVALNDITDWIHNQIYLLDLGKIYIKITAIETGESEIPYTLNITRIPDPVAVPEDESEGNGSFDTQGTLLCVAPNPPCTTDNSVGDLSDVNDYFSYTVLTDEPYEFTLSWDDVTYPDADLDLFVYDDVKIDGDVVVLGSAINAHTEPEIIRLLHPQQISAGDVVIIQVHGLVTGGVEIEYTLTITPAGENTPLAPAENDNLDDSHPQAGEVIGGIGYVVGTVQSYDADDLSDYWQYQAAAIGNYRFQVTWPDKADDIDLGITDLTHEGINVSSKNANTNIETISGIHMDAGMTLYIHIDGYKVRNIVNHVVPYKLLVKLEQ